MAEEGIDIPWELDPSPTLDEPPTSLPVSNDNNDGITVDTNDADSKESTSFLMKNVTSASKTKYKSNISFKYQRPILFVLIVLIVFCTGAEAAALRHKKHEVGLDSVAIESGSSTFIIDPKKSSTTLQGDEEKQDNIDSEVGNQLHPGLLYERDFSKITHGFHLGKHLMAPTTSDIRDGVENSRRLARNAIKLGIDNDMHRKLIGDSDRARPLIQEFNGSIPLPSNGPRVRVDDNSIDALPFRDGPGVQAFFPEGTKKFWKGEDPNTTLKMWEIIACPVMDVQAYLVDPFRCTFGIPDHGSNSDGTLVDFFKTLNGTAIKDAMVKAAIPLAVEFVYNFSGLAFIENMLRKVCSLVAGTIDSALNLISLGFYGILATYPDCDDDDTCDSGNDPSKTTEAIDKFEKRTGEIVEANQKDCPDCTCDRRRLGEKLFPLSPNKEGYTSVGENDPTNDDLIRGAKMYAFHLGLNEEEAEKILSKIFEESDEQANENEVIDKDNLVQSEQVRDAKTYASKLGLKGKGADQVFLKLFDSLSDIDAPFNDKLEEQIKEDLNDPQNAAFIKSLVDKNIEENDDKYSRMLALQVVAGAVDKKTGRLNVDQLKETLSVLSTTDHMSRKLASDECQGNKDHLPLECGCNRAIDGVKKFVKESIITPVLTTLVESVSDLGEAFQDATDNQPLALAINFAKFIDPFSAESPLGIILQGVIHIFQEVVGGFIYDGDCGGGPCADLLPSKINEVLQLKESRDGDIYLAAGCSPDFTGELLWYQPVFTFVDQFLGAVSDGIIEFFNIPVVVLKLIFNAVTSLFDHMGAVCSYLGGQIAYGGATFENTRYALQELACRDPFDIELQKGYGCDGLDNTCDDDKQIDECAEDIYPPDIDVSDALQHCSNKIFPSAQDAVECFSSLVTAVDDCKEVDLQVTASSGTPGQATVELKAVAQGCGNRPDEDTTIIEIPVIIAEVELLRGYGCDGIDNNQNGFDNSITLDQAIDECAEDIFPPEMETGTAILQCINKIFPTSQDALECFNAPGLVSAVDDCKKVDLTFEDKDAPTCSAIIGIKAVALGCGNRTVEDTTQLDFTVAVDNDIPKVTCDLSTQGLRGTGAGVFTDLDFSFTAVDGGDKCTDTKDLAVTIEVLSDEVVATGEEMVIISEPGASISIWAEDHTCKTANNGQCKISSPKKSRTYMVRVTVTDEAGNVGIGKCNTVVGNQASDGADPFFVIAKLDITGGVENVEQSSGGPETAKLIAVDLDPAGEATQVTASVTESSQPPLQSSLPSSCLKRSVDPEGDCTRCCSGECNKWGTCSGELV